MKVIKPGQKAPRISKQYSSGRYWTQKNCTTKLSTYTSKKHCFLNRPVPFPPDAVLEIKNG